MLKMIITEAVVSKGFDGKPAVQVYTGDNGFQSISFRIGKRVYDGKAENNHRWINFHVKGFRDLCERIKKMKLKEGSFINLVARYDEESWVDKETGEKRTALVLILDEIEYCFNGGNSQKNGQGATESKGSVSKETTAGDSGTGQFYPPQPQGQPYPPQPQGMPYPGAPQGAPCGQPGMPPQTGSAQQTAPPMPGNFTGFENFGGPQDQFF